MLFLQANEDAVFAPAQQSQGSSAQQLHCAFANCLGPGNKLAQRYTYLPPSSHNAKRCNNIPHSHTAAGRYSIYTASGCCWRAAKQHSCIRSPKTKAVAQHRSGPIWQLSSFSCHKQRQKLRVWGLQVAGWRRKAVVQRQGREGCLHSTSCAQQVACRPLGRADMDVLYLTRLAAVAAGEGCD
eukprot:GHRQ01024418.1.p2 GENE.GHRQ01024418.1~~GHRQ01024418.1.p2  ORF type:complete len:183 (-),score=21.13 GHRQ01024418.1:105-653(-)